MAKPNYPAILTNATWQAEKGKIAKLAGETGLGAALDACEKAYHAVDGGKFSPKLTYPEAALIETDWLAAKAEGAKFESVRGLLFKARDVANSTAAKYKASPLVPKSSAEYALKVGKECENFAVVLKSYGDVVFKEFEEAKVTFANKQKILAAALKNAVPKCRTGFADVKRSPDANTYSAKCWQAVRGLGAQVAILPFLKPFQPEFKVLASIQPSALKDKSAVLAHIAKLEVIVGKIEAVIPK